MTTETSAVNRLLREIPFDRHNEFLGWAVSGIPVRSEAEKQRIIKAVKEIWNDTHIKRGDK